MKYRLEIAGGRRRAAINDRLRRIKEYFRIDASGTGCESRVSNNATINYFVWLISVAICDTSFIYSCFNRFNDDYRDASQFLSSFISR